MLVIVILLGLATQSFYPCYELFIMKALIAQFQNLSPLFWLMCVGCCSLIVALDFYLHSSLASMLAAFSGVCFAFFAGAMRLICYFFGLCYCISYAIIAFEARLYGDVFLSLIYLPLNLIGLIEWHKYPYKDSKIKLKSLKSLTPMLIILSISTLIYGLFLSHIRSSYPFLNALSVALQLFATYLQSKRYIQSYLLVTLANIIMCYIWFKLSLVESKMFLQFFNACIFLIIGIVFCIKWQREYKSQKEI